MSLYKILEISPNAQLPDIKKAYHRMALKYHPDKNPSDEAKDKYEEISMAYNILKDEKSRIEYSKMNKNEEKHFWLLLQGWIRDLSGDDLSGLFTGENYTNLNEILLNLDSFSLTQIISWFNNPDKVPVSKCSDFIESETDTWKDNNCLFYYDLPLKYLHPKKDDIVLQFNVSIQDIVERKLKKIQIKRNINGKHTKNTFFLKLTNPFIVFPNAGDWSNGNKGSLIINLIAQEPWQWNNEGIYMEKHISLYQMLYGLNLELEFGNLNTRVNNWVPHRDGWKIEISYFEDINIFVKLILSYEDDEIKKDLLRSYFN